jgi:hypothetical protein
MIDPAAFFSSGTQSFFWTSEQTFEEAETVIHLLGEVIGDNHFEILVSIYHSTTRVQKEEERPFFLFFHLVISLRKSKHLLTIEMRYNLALPELNCLYWQPE